MWNFYRTRHTAGNICLVLFTAFLFTILVAPCTMVGNAEAAQQTIGGDTVTTVQLSGSDYVQGGQTKTITGTSSGYQLLVDLAISPLTHFETLRIDFVNGDGTILSVYGSETAKVTYKAYSSVYGWVYSLAYLAPSEFYLSDNPVVYGKVYIGSTLFENILYTLTLQPPQTSDGSPSSGGTTPPQETKSPLPVGQLIETKNPDGTSTAKIETDPAKLTDLINSDKPLVIEVPAGTVAAEVKVELAATNINQAAEKSKEITIKTGNAQFVIPPQALQVAALTDLVKADPNTKITLDVKEVTSASVSLADKVGVPDNANLMAVGKVFTFTITATSSSGSSGITTFNGTVRVCIPYTDADLGGNKEDSLAAYRITSTGLVYLGGEVDKANNLLWFDTNSFSAYTLMAKICAFADIMSHWAKNDIELMAGKGIVKGMTANKFTPDAGITRAQFATLLVKALGLAEVKPAKATFKDVKTGAWYYGAVEAAAAKDLVSGYKDGTFKPDGKITREEMAVMIASALKAGGKTVAMTSAESSQLLGKFSDKKQIGSWAQQSAAIAVKEGIISGRTASTFVAKANATRAEGTVMIKLALKSLNKL